MKSFNVSQLLMRLRVHALRVSRSVNILVHASRHTPVTHKTVSSAIRVW